MNRKDGRFNEVPKFSLPASQSAAQQHTPFVNRSEGRFNAVPKFSSGTPVAARNSSAAFSSTPSLPSPHSRFTLSARQSSLRNDAIEDASEEEEDSDIEGLNEEYDDVIPTVEAVEDILDSSHDASERQVKRRRISLAETRDGGIEENSDENHEGNDGDEDEDMLLHEEGSDSEETTSSSLPDPEIATPMPAQRHRGFPDSSHTINTPRFVLPSTPRRTQQATPFQHSSLSSKPQPPKFAPIDPERDPNNADNEAQDPVPDIFSPRRRGQRHVPGGLAEELTGWLFSVGNESRSTAKHRQEEEHYDVRLIVEEVRGGSKASMTLVRGRQLHGDGSRSSATSVGAVQFILTGEGMTKGLQKQEAVERKKIIGIKGPLWEVVLEGEKWGVGVSWRVLN